MQCNCHRVYTAKNARDKRRKLTPRVNEVSGIFYARVSNEIGGEGALGVHAIERVRLRCRRRNYFSHSNNSKTVSAMVTEPCCLLVQTSDLK